MNTSNPLMQFARRPELSIKLPSDGNWYEEGFINYTMTGDNASLIYCPSLQTSNIKQLFPLA